MRSRASQFRLFRIGDPGLLPSPLPVLTGRDVNNRPYEPARPYGATIRVPSTVYHTGLP